MFIFLSLEFLTIFLLDYTFQAKACFVGWLSLVLRPLLTGTHSLWVHMACSSHADLLQPHRDISAIH